MMKSTLQLSFHSTINYLGLNRLNYNSANWASKFNMLRVGESSPLAWHKSPWFSLLAVLAALRHGNPPGFPTSSTVRLTSFIQANKKQPYEMIVFCWWRWRESHPRPKCPDCRFSMLSFLIVLHQAEGNDLLVKFYRNLTGNDDSYCPASCLYIALVGRIGNVRQNGDRYQAKAGAKEGVAKNFATAVFALANADALTVCTRRFTRFTIRPRHAVDTHRHPVELIHPHVVKLQVTEGIILLETRLVNKVCFAQHLSIFIFMQIL